MSDIKYAYLKGQTWLYRRNYPKDVAPVIGSRALKQSLKTGDVKAARSRAVEVNARYEDLVRKIRSGAEDALSAAETSRDTPGWIASSEATFASLRATLEASGPIMFRGKAKAPTVSELLKTYLTLRGRELR